MAPIKNPSFKATLSRRWLLGGYALEFRCGYELIPFHLSVLIDQIIRKLLPFEPDMPSALINIKGCDPLSTLGLVSLHAPPRSIESPPSSELLFVSGEFLQGNSDSGKGMSAEWHPFIFTVETPFLDFSAKNEIRHTLQTRTIGEFPTAIAPRHIGRAFPLRPRYFRLGLDLFGEKYFSLSLGSTPVVTESLIVEASEREVWIDIRAEHLRSKAERPLASFNLLDSLDDIIGCVCASSLRETLLRDMSSAAHDGS